jgi:Tfp pilus assembly protein PilN
MEIGLIPKKPTEKPLWQIILLYFSVGFLFMVVLAMVILSYAGSKAKLEIAKLDQELNRPKTAAEIQLEREVLQAQARISNFKSLIESAKPASKVFELLERTTHPAVVFGQLSFSAVDNKISLSGQTDNFQTLGQQLLIFQSEPLIIKSNLEQIGIGKSGSVEFNISLVLNENFYEVFRPYESNQGIK